MRSDNSELQGDYLEEGEEEEEEDGNLGESMIADRIPGEVDTKHSVYNIPAKEMKVGSANEYQMEDLLFKQAAKGRGKPVAKQSNLKLKIESSSRKVGQKDSLFQRTYTNNF